MNYESEVLSNAMDLNNQLQTLEDSLKKVQSKFIEEWMGTQVDSWLHQQDRLHTENIKQYQKTLSDLEENLSQLRLEDSRKRKVGVNMGEELTRLKEHIENVNHETNTLLQQNEQIKQEVTLKTEQNLLKKKVLEEEDKAAKTQTQELEKSASFFQERLALDVKKVSGGRMQLVFRCIDYKNASRPFYFFVKIKEDRTYEVSECEPPVPELPQLINKLNETNNFKAFILTMRKKFKELV